MSAAHVPAHQGATRQPLLAAAGAGTGILYVVLVFVGYLALGPGSSGNVPSADASRTEIAGWLAAHPADATFWAGVYVEALGLFAFIAFVAYLCAVLRSSDTDRGWLSMTVFGAGVVAVSIKLTSFPAGVAAQFRSAEGLDPALGAALVDMNQVSYTLAFVADAVMLAAAGAAILRTRALPRWLGAGALAIAIAVLATTPVTLSAPGIAEAPIQLVVLWIIVASAVMFRRAVRGHGALA